MTDLREEVENSRARAMQELEQVASADQLEQWRVVHIGRKGAVPMLLRRLKDLPENVRKEIGALANTVREELEELYKHQVSKFAPATNPEKLPTANNQSQTQQGHLHPLTLSLRRIQHIFDEMGFMIVEGPEVEEARYNFDQLNISMEHPARAETDTFYIEEGENLVLRTHTSPVQLRAVLEHNLTPPFRVLSPGRVFRAERTDATHETTFFQFEGLVVGKGATIAQFKGVAEQFYSAFFGKEVLSRLRPAYFPFVEPGFEVDISCVFCDQKGCRVCKHTGWIEVMGAGMVHPNVLRNMNIDPETHQGYAFGGSVDRITMLANNIDDIRLFWSGNIKFLKQFS